MGLGLDPEAVGEFENAWKANKGHWSGMRRSDLMKALEPTSNGLRRLYKRYSWSAHMVLEPVLDYNWSEHGQRRRENRATQSASEVDCIQAADLLRETWSTVAAFFRVAP